MFPLTRWESPVFRNGSNRCTANLAGVFAAEEYYLRRVTVFIGPSWSVSFNYYYKLFYNHLHSFFLSLSKYIYFIQTIKLVV